MELQDGGKREKRDCAESWHIEPSPCVRKILKSLWSLFVCAYCDEFFALHCMIPEKGKFLTIVFGLLRTNVVRYIPVDSHGGLLYSFSGKVHDYCICLFFNI
jgi:hypothetical protein